MERLSWIILDLALNAITYIPMRKAKGDSGENRRQHDYECKDWTNAAICQEIPAPTRAGKSKMHIVP